MGKPGGERSEQLVEQLAQRVDRWQLTLPAILFLEIAKPFGFIASQGLLLCQPLLGFFYDETKIADYSELLSKRSNLDQLMAKLESQKMARNRGGKEKSGWTNSA